MSFGADVARRISPARMPIRTWAPGFTDASGTSRRNWPSQSAPARLQVIVPLGLVHCEHNSIQQILHPGKLCNGLLPRRLQHLVGCALRQQFAGLSKTITRSLSAKTSSRAWVTYIMGIRCSSFQARRSSINRERVGASSPESGSSSSRIDGFITNERASATRWRCPPEISRGLRSRKSAMRKLSSIA